jgi:membrane peptidoglycan carboxypeptidase
VRRAPGSRARRLLRLSTALLGIPLLAVAVLAGYVWVTTPLPPAAAAVPPQQSVLRFADGSELARLGAENRVPVPLSAVSTAARHAVLAAEDRGFYDGVGISPRGIARALWVNARSGEVEQGGSTIAQQYARAAYLTQDRTWDRKAREAVLAVKLNRERGREQVLEDYLNTVYFGRGAHGIETAARTWFGKPAAELTAGEGAVLASLLRSTVRYDPDSEPERARDRWRYVLEGMAEKGWLEEPVDAVPYPEVLPRQPIADRFAGPNGYLVSHVLEELAALGFREEAVQAGGLVVETTFDPRAQAEAVRAVQSALPAELPDGVYAALVSVEPGTGRVRAEYGGADYLRRPFNAVTQGAAQAGSSFKPYVLAAALERQVPLSAELDGSSPQLFGDWEVRNFGGGSYGKVDVVTATAKSVNTAYVQLGVRAGPHRVARVAAELGITADMSVERDSPVISLGVTTVTPLEQANAFATLAAGGLRATPFVVERVAGPGGELWYQAEPQVEQTLDQAVAADVSFALQQVVTSGTGTAARVPGRPSAGKTGTTSRNTAAWYVGYTPQLSTAVAVYSERQDMPLRGFAGVREVTGGTLPARIWGRYTAAALAGEPVLPFPERADVGPPAPEPAPTLEPDWRPPGVEPLPPRQDPGPRQVAPPEPGPPSQPDPPSQPGPPSEGGAPPEPGPPPEPGAPVDVLGASG